MNLLRRMPFELFFWITALVLLGMAEPEVHGQAHHFSLCPLANMGFDWCPGCGIGRSITQLLHGNIAESVTLHWFGIPALMILFYRIIQLGRREFMNFKKLKYKEKRYV